MDALLDKAEEDKKEELQLEMEKKEKKMHMRQLGTIRFIGELFKLNMLTERIIHECIRKLLSEGNEEALECLCCLLKTVGKVLDQGSKNPHESYPMDQYFAQMQKIVDMRLTRPTVHFMLQDVIDLKRDNWVPRRDENNPKTIDQIHEEAERETSETQQYFPSMSYSKRMPKDRRRTSGRYMGVTEYGWPPTYKRNKKSYNLIDPAKLKLPKPDEIDNIRLGGGVRGSWLDPDGEKILTNRQLRMESNGGPKRFPLSTPHGQMSNCDGGLKFSPYVTWEVPDFFKLPIKNKYFLDSAKFHFDGGTWCLRLFPRGCEGYTCDTYFIDVWLVRLVPSFHEQHSCEIGLVKNDGEELGMEEESDCQYRMLEGRKLSVHMFYAPRSIVEKNKNIYAPRNTLTVFCRVLPFEVGNIATSSAATEHTATQTELEGATFVVSEPPSPGKDTPSVEKLQSDYKKLLKSEAESDLLVVVSGREFRAHRNILRARSPVFDAMFEHETEEKQSGKVVIDDLNPDAFRDFLEYLYTGRVDAISKENVFGLYAAADKYDVQQLKSEALEHIRRTLSVESFCDAMALALRHLEHDLLDRAVDFFKDNLPDIIVTVKWQVFMKENSTVANELLVKTFVPKKDK